MAFHGGCVSSTTKSNVKIIKPTQNRVAIKPAEPDKFTPAGLVIPESMQSQQSIGQIVAIGPDVKALKKGDNVLYGKYAGMLVEVQGCEYIICKEEDVLAVF